MIIDKKNGQVVSDNKRNTEPHVDVNDIPIEVPEQIEENGAIAVIHAFIDMLKMVTWQYGVKDSPKIFKTVQRDDGQYERIIRRNVGNMEEGIAFPAAFVHLINVHWNVTAQRFNEGMADVRIRFILNQLAPHDPDHDTDVEYVAERVHQTITEQKYNYPCLNERCVLQYVDPMESFDYSLQPCWMTYNIKFTTTNIWVTRNKVNRRIVIAPFTNHADQDQTDPKNNLFGHNNLSHQEDTYDVHTDYTNYIPKQNTEEDEENK